MNWIATLFHSLIEAIFGFCTHRNQSRPFTIDGHTYKVCMDCSQQIFYSAETMLPLSRRELRRLQAQAAGVAVMPATAEAREAMVLRGRGSAAA